MSKITKYVLIGCSIGLLIGGSLFAIGTCFRPEPSTESVSIQGDIMQKDVLEMLDTLDIKIDGVDLLQDIDKELETIPEMAEIVDKEEMVDSFGNVNVECQVASIKLVRGENYGVLCIFPEDEMPQVTKEGDTIQIKQDVEKDTFEPYGDEEVRSIVISIPEEVALKNIRINNNVGDVCMEGIEAESYEVILNTGNTEVKDCQLEECKVNGSVGGVSLETVEAENCIVSLHTGDIEIENCLLNTCDIADNIGTISVKMPLELSAVHIDAETNVGTISIDDVKQGQSYEADGTEAVQLKVGINIGDILINGEK